MPLALDVSMRSLPRLAALASLLLVAACSAPSEDEEADSDEAAVESVDARLGEKLEPNEAAIVRRIADAATTQITQAHTAGSVAKRDAHPKAHGCVSGSFTVDANVPADLAVGTFRPGKRYDTWVRFSNGTNADDTKDDARGMALKLIGVDGERLLADNARTHDILLSNHHTFFIKNLEDYVGFMETVTTKGSPTSFFINGWNPLKWHVGTALRAKAFIGQPITSPLTSRYWSATPYKLGNQAVKYSATPCSGPDISGDHPADPNFLSNALKAGLASGNGACFDFMIQRRANEKLSVEDSTETWKEDQAPFVKIARIEIPAQTFDSPAQTNFCENLSFTPWHGTTEHRPLGSMNRTRKVVYEATSKARHSLNNARRAEPTDLTVR
jgi:hypothetical protein